MEVPRSESPLSHGRSPAMTFSSEGIARGEIAAAQAELEVLRVQVRNMESELLAKEEENRSLRQDENTEVAKLKGLIDEKIGGRQQHAQYLNETSARLHEMLQEKDAKLHTLSAQILDFEQSLSGAELECQELKSRLALSTHHTSASDDRVVSMRHSLASLHDTIALRSAQLHNERAAHSRQLQVLSSALVAVEASLLTPLVPSKDAGSPPSSPLPTPGKFSWLTSEACILTIGQQGGGAIPIAQERAFQTRVVLYISVRDAGMRLMRLPESAEILVKGRGCVEDSDHLDDPTEDDTSFRAASTEAATIVEDHQLSLQGYGGLCVHSVTRIARSTWEVSVYVDPHLFNAKTAGSLVGTPLAGPVPNPGAELVTSSALLRKGKSPHRSPPPPPTDKKRVGLRLVAADNVCMSSRTFLVKSGGGVQSAGGYASEEVNARNVEAALRCSDVFVFPDPIIVRYGHEESGGSNPPSPTSLAKLTDTSHVFLKSILTIRDERGRCTSETDLLSRKKEFQAGLKCTVRLPSSASSGLSIATAGMESFIPIECGVLALCKVPLGKYSALQAASPQPLCVDFTWEETAEETQGDGFNDALSAQQAVPTISTNVAVRSSSSGGGFATDVNLRARFIQKFLARGLHAVMTGHRTESRPMDTQTATSTTVPHEGVVGRTLERIASLHKEELLQTLLDDGAVVKKFADEKLEAVSAVETKLEEALLKVDKKEAEVTALHIEMAELRDTDNVAKDEYDNLVAELAVAQAAATASELHSEDHANEIEALQQKHHEEKEELLRRVTEAEENEKSLKRSVEDCSQQMVQMTTASHDSLEGSAKELQAMSQKLSELDANYQAALTELNETCQREESAVAKMAKQRDQLAELQGLCTNTESRFREMMTQNESRVNDTVLTAEANEAVLRAQIATLEEALGNSTRSNGHEMDRLATHIAQLTSSAETSVHDHETQLSEVRARFSDAEEALRGKVQRLEGSLEGMEAEKRRNDTRVRMLTEELDKWETQAQGLATQAEEYSQKVRAAQERIEYLERELESAVTQANAISVEWGRTQTSSDAELTELRTANQALRDSLVTAEEQAKALQAQHEELADDIAHATNRIDSQNAASAEMKAEIATKNTAVARGDKEADRLRNEIQSLESHASALRIDLQGAAARNDVVTGENAQLRDELKSAQRTAEQSAVHVNDLRNNRDIAAAQAEADMEAMEWELKEARAECAREAAQARALETDMDFLLSQVDYAKSALFGVSASYDEVTPTYTSGSGAPAGTRDVAFHALMADHATTVRLLRSDQELQFAKISHLFHNALGALVRNVLIEQSATQKDRIAELKRELTETQIVLDSRMSELSLLRDQVTFAKQTAEVKIESEEAWRRRSETRADELETELSRLKQERGVLEGENRDRDSQVKELKGQLNEEIRIRVRLQEELSHHQQHHQQQRGSPFPASYSEHDVHDPLHEIQQLQRMVDTLKAERRLDAQQYARLKTQLEDERSNTSMAEAKMRNAKDLAATWESSIQSQHQSDLLHARKNTYQAESERAELEHRALVFEKKLESMQLDLDMHKQRAATSEHALKEANESIEAYKQEEQQRFVAKQGGGGGGGGGVSSVGPKIKRFHTKGFNPQISAFLDMNESGSRGGGSGAFSNKSTPRKRGVNTPNKSPAKSPSVATHYVNIC